MLVFVRSATIVLAALLAACAPAPPPAAAPGTQSDSPPKDPAAEPAYAHAAEELAGLNRRAEALLARGQADQAGAIVAAAEPLENRLLSAPRPTLAAMEAASDRDDLYGRMLLSNHNYGWARMTFQKNLIRWKNWKPRTEESARRLKQAASAVAECDRRMAQ